MNTTAVPSNGREVVAPHATANWLQMIEAALDKLSLASGVLGAVALLATALLVASQIVARLIGTQIPGADDFAAWSMAATVFLALPYALRQGAHIRVTLLLQVLPRLPRLACEIFATLLALILVGWSALHCAYFVHDSYVNHEVSQGLVVLPMWLPQLSMPIGLGGLFLMLAGRLLCVLRGNLWKEEENG